MLKETICFLKAGELPGASGGEVLASFGALPDAPRGCLGAGGGVRGARRSVGGAQGELWGALGSSFGGSGDNVGGLRIDFLSSWTTFATDFSRGASLRPDESRIHTIRNTQSVTTTSERRLRQPKCATKLAQEKNLSCPALQNMNARALPPGSAHVAAGLSESADPEGRGGLGVWVGGGKGSRA
mgnify:CR=1 FL=1